MKVIDKFIVWYMKRHNAIIKSDGCTVRAFTTRFYSDIIIPVLSEEKEREYHERPVTVSGGSSICITIRDGKAYLEGVESEVQE